MRASALKKAYGGKVVLDVPEISFEPGRVCAVIGANGCGKSTLARILSGVLPPDGGTVEADGARVGFMPQRSYAFYGTLRRNLMLGIPRGVRKEEANARIEELMAALGLTELADVPAKRLSGGETARMALARLLAGSYDLLILDEPTAALDIQSTLAAERLVRAYVEKRGAGVVLVTHSIKQARRLADEVLFLSEGLPIERGETAKTLDDPQTEELKRFLEFLGD